MDLDPTSIFGIGLGVFGTKDLVVKFFGPTVEYFGDGLKNVAERGCNNLRRVVRIAADRTGNGIETAGVINPRALKLVIEEGLFCEDEIQAEYLGGVLASSRTVDGKDDRGVSYLNDIKSLSSYQLRTHYLIYSAITHYGCRIQTNVKSWYGHHPHETITLVFDDDSYLAAVGCTNPGDKQQISSHCLIGLEARQLLSGGYEAFDNWQEGPARAFDSPWRFCWPTRHGHDLFAWGLGLGGLHLSSYFDVPVEAVTLLQPHLRVLGMDLGKKYIEANRRSYA